MAAEENLGEIYVKIKADVSGLEKELTELKRRIDKDSKENQAKLNFKARFDASIAKLHLSELQKLRTKLQKEFDKKLSLNVDAASLDRTRQKIASVDNQLKEMGKNAQSFGSKLASGLTAIGGIAAFFKVIKDSIDAAKESAIAQAQIKKAVETTGQAAGFTAKQLFKMAEELQKLSAIDDDIILTNVTNNLLTFKNVSGDAFKRAQQAVLDLNAVISKGEIGALTSQTIQLGKALNDPIQGMSALTRVGIAFTEQQKAQVKSLVESGKLFEAQSLILAEIEGQYGGQAEALAKATGGMQQFSVTVGNLLEKLGAPLLTVLGKVATSITSLLEPVENVNEGFIEQKKALDDLQKSVTPLLNRYDELKSKTSLNKNEQDELRSIIIRVANAIPSAISALDDYGVATDINRAKVEEFIKTEQKRLAVINKNDIDEFNKKKKLAEQKKKLLEEELKRSLETGKKTVQFSTAQGVIEREVKISDQDIKNAQQQIKALQDEIDGYNAQLDLLTGKIDEIKPIDTGKKVLETTAGVEVDKTITTKFQSQIPPGYTAEQVAEFEKLKFAVQGYVDFRKAQIENTYKQEVDNAKGNAVEIAKAEENKLLAYARLNQEIIDLQKEASDATNKIVSDSLKEREKELEIDLENESQLLSDNYTKRQEAIDNYYENTKNKDSGYIAWKLKKIEEEKEAFLSATGDEKLAEQMKTESLKELQQEYFDWRIEQWKKQNKVANAAIEAMTEGMTNAFQLIQIRTKESASAIENVFVNMANTFIAQVERMIAEWISFQLLKGIAGVILAPVTGGASAAAAAAAHSGGEFLGTNSGIRKMAAGGSFIVPPGFPNDSYPLLVESGERVTVNSASNVGMQDKLLKSIHQQLQVLSSITLEGQMSKKKQETIGLYGKIENDAIYISNKRASKLIGRMG